MPTFVHQLHNDGKGSIVCCVYMYMYMYVKGAITHEYLVHVGNIT